MCEIDIEKVRDYNVNKSDEIIIRTDNSPIDVRIENPNELIKVSIYEYLTKKELRKVVFLTNQENNILKLINDTIHNDGIDMLPIEELEMEAEEKGYSKEEVYNAIQNLEKKKLIYRPRNGFVKINLISSK
ncbi:MAG: hypothetical protein PHQ98_04530 [Candidatus ainarchaeum sp.]|nr:hypothetical protein [Candidatus ainarchaeum sp.]